MSILGSYVTFLKPLAPYFVDAAYIFLGMAMAALGMSVNFKLLRTWCASIHSVLLIIGDFNDSLLHSS